MARGFFSLVLHAHLPYIRHPEHEEFMEERWLFEAITETYVPLLRVFQRLEKDSVPFAITMSITPPLMEMLESKDLQEKYIRHLEKLIKLSEKEIDRTKNEAPQKHKMAQFYHDDFQETLHIFRDQYHGSIIRGFIHFQEKGNLEIITCNATHGFLPLMERYPQAVRAQIHVGKNTYRKHIGKDPVGMWLAECGYTPGIDRYLAEESIRYFFVDSHGFWYAENQPRYGVYRPMVTENGVMAFSRDPESSEQVWSAETGYPGDYQYREFYRDVGFDRELDYIQDFIDKSGVRVNTGIKYHKVTGNQIDLGAKEYYDFYQALEVAKEHARDFAWKKHHQAEKLYDTFQGVQPIIVAPFDAELFGHWWFEGPFFIEHLFREMAKGMSVEAITPSRFVENHLTTLQINTPEASTWGANGYNEVWLNGSNDWIYPHLDEMIERMIELANSFKHEQDPLKTRALNQAARELLLAQSSDWAFIMTTGTTVEYASKRTKQHIERFMKIFRWLQWDEVDEGELQHFEWIDSIFDDIDYKVYATES